MNKIKLFVVSVGSAIVGSVAPLLAHAQAFVPGGVASTSLAYEAGQNGAYLTTAYNEIINFLTSTGGVLFMIVISILGVVVWLAVKTPRHVVNA